MICLYFTYLISVTHETLDSMSVINAFIGPSIYCQGLVSFGGVGVGASSFLSLTISARNSFLGTHFLDSSLSL